MRTLQITIAFVAFTLAFLNWWVPGFRQYQFLGTLPDLPTLSYTEGVKK